MNSGRFGITIRWQHLKCTVFAKTLTKVEEIEGFEYLEPAQQAEVGGSGGGVLVAILGCAKMHAMGTLPS